MILPYKFHVPVLLNQVIQAFRVSTGKKYIDATIAGGGYAFEIMKLGGSVLGIDLDQEAIDYIEKKFKAGEEIFLEQGNFRDIKIIAEKNGFNRVDGIIFDLGMSTYQLERSGRGFSYQRNETLDMRLDPTSEVTAVDIINNYSQDKLYEIFTKYSEELNSGTIAHAIVRARTLRGPVERVNQLVLIIEQELQQLGFAKNSKNYNTLRIKTLSRIFQSFRIAVNNELDNLKNALAGAVDLLNSGGRIAVISYHSLEDRIVKFTLQDYKKKGILKIITHSPILADYKEQQINPKSKSAKLRIAEKI